MANNNNEGLMQPKDIASNTPITEKFKSILSPTSGTPLSLEEKLNNLSQSELNTVTSQAKLAHLSSKMTAKVHGAPPQSYIELLSSIYPKSDSTCNLLLQRYYKLVILQLMKILLGDIKRNLAMIEKLQLRYMQISLSLQMMMLKTLLQTQG